MKPAARRRALGLLALALVAAAAAVILWLPPPGQGTATGPAPLAFVGVSTCEECHADETRRWRGSHHDLAMQEPSEKTVLGDFDDAQLHLRGRDAPASSARTAASSSAPTARTAGSPTTRSAYTFGVTPAAAVPDRAAGRPLPGALASPGTAAPKKRGRPALVPPLPGRARGPPRRAALDEALAELEHPVRRVPLDEPAQGLPARRGPVHDHLLRDRTSPARRATGRARATWSGPRQAQARGAGAERGAGPHRPLHRAAQPRAGRWTRRAASRGPRSSSRRASRSRPAPAATRGAGCSPRTTGPGGCSLDTHRPALLDEGLYYADGQMRDEVYNWGSFLQSRMYAAGVTCSDCHDAARPEGEGRPGRGLLVLPPAGALRHAQAPLPPGEGQGRVVRRLPHADRDVHGGRPAARPLVPRAAAGPDRGARAEENAPNACNDCHRDRSPQWAAQAVRRWFPGGHAAARRTAATRSHAGRTLPAGRGAAPARRDPRPEAAGDRARHGGLAAAAAPRTAESLPALEQAAADPDPLVRLGAATTLDALPAAGARADRRPPALGPACGRCGSRRFRPSPTCRTPSSRAEARAAFDRSLDDYLLAQRSNAERPESHVNLGIVYAKRGRLEDARRDYEAALRLAPWFVPGLRQPRRPAPAAGPGRRGRGRPAPRPAGGPTNASVHHALGLLLVAAEATGRGAGRAGARRRARSRRSPDFAYAYAIGLHSRGPPRRGARASCARRRQRSPGRAGPARRPRHDLPRARATARGASVGAQARRGGPGRPVRARPSRLELEAGHPRREPGAVDWPRR